MTLQGHMMTPTTRLGYKVGSYVQKSVSCGVAENGNVVYTLCTNLDKSGANHESRIVYTQVIRVRFMPDLIPDSRFVNSQLLVVSAQTIKGHELDSSVMHLSLYTVRAFWRIFSLFYKFLNSSQLINYQLTGLWLFVMVRKWVHKS